MRKWIDIFENATSLMESWFRSVPVNDHDPSKTTEVYVNPTRSEFLKLWRETEMEYGKSSLPFRAFIGIDDSLYIWSAWCVVHSDMDQYLPRHRGGYLYLGEQGVVMNDLNWQYDETEDAKTYLPLVGEVYYAIQNNKALRRIYGSPITVIGRDDEDAGGVGFINGEMEINPDFIKNHVVQNA